MHHCSLPEFNVLSIKGPYSMGYVPPPLEFRDQLFQLIRGGELEHFFPVGFHDGLTHLGDGTADDVLLTL